MNNQQYSNSADDHLEIQSEKGSRNQNSRQQHMVSFQNQSNHIRQETEELLNSKIEDELENISHILEIKALLDDIENVTETEIKVSLQMLTLIVLSVEDLTLTNIGKTVSALQKHWSKKVIQEATIVMEKFKNIVKERIVENADLSERTKGPAPPTVLAKDVLLNPPMDERIPMCSKPPFELITYFEDLDDDGNLKIEESYSYENKKKRPREKRAIQKEKDAVIVELIKPKNSGGSHKSSEIEIQRNIPPPTENKRKLELVLREDSQPIPTKKRQKRKESKKKWTNQIMFRQSDTKQDSSILHEKTEDKTMKKKDKNEFHHERSNDAAGLISHSSGCSDDEAKMEEKLENTKRKLQEGYQAHERGRRNTKFIEVIDVPKEESSRRGSRRKQSNRSYLRWFYV